MTMTTALAFAFGYLGGFVAARLIIAAVRRAKQ